MKKINLFRLGILSLAVLMVFAGCSAKNDKEAQKAVQTAINNSYKVKSGDYAASVDGKMTTTDPSAGFKELDGSMDLSGVYDVNQSVDPKFTFAVKMEGAADGGEKQGLVGELKMANKNLYFKVEDSAVFAALGPYKDMVAPFLNKWWYVEAPAEVVEEIGVYGDEVNLTEKQKEMKKLSEDTMWFTNVKNKGDDKVDGVDAIKYSVELDKEALKKYVVESSKISGEKLSEDDEKDMKEVFDLVDFKGNFWASKKDNVAIKMEGSVTMKADKKTDNTGFSFDVVYTISNVNGAVSIEIPVDAEKFDPFATIGLGETGGATAP